MVSDLFLDILFIKLFGGIGYGCHHELSTKFWFHLNGYYILILRLNFWGHLGFKIRPWSVTDRPPWWRGPPGSGRVDRPAP
jgi:hypothetical protein